MSMIDKMSIIGIRAFGPDDKHQQVIQFQHPLTLLVGPNGAGKTTIIECLKYATTGEHPQNTKGGAFVHDPKLANETEVKAKVRLRCRNVKGHMVEVERSMIATQKAKKVQFKTLDGILIKRRNDEEPVHLTSKCADLNQQMVEELGVSKAVLDNVIFCHQEDSNWPLSEGKSVKQKFDDIFAATRYIKALEEIRKIQKLQKGKLGQDKVEMKHLKTHCETAKEKKKLLEENIRPIESELRELKKKQTEIVVLDTELKTTKSRRQQMVEDERKLKSRIKNEFKASCYKLRENHRNFISSSITRWGTDEQLKELQSGQEQVLNAKRRQQNQLEKQINPLQDEINSFSKKKMNLSVEQGKLEEAVKNAKAQQNQRNELIKDSSDRYGINLSYSGSELTDTEASSFVHSFQSHCAKEENKLQNLKNRFDVDLKRVEEELKQTWQMKTELQEGNKHKKKNLSALKEKSAETTRDLHRLQTAADSGQLDELQIRLQKAEEKLQAAERSNKVDDLRRNLTEQNESKLELQRKIESLDSLIISMHKSAESRTKIEMLKKEKQSKEDAIINLKRKNQAMLEELGLASQSSFPDKMKMMRWIRGKESEVSSAQVCFDRKKSDFTQLSTKKEMVSSQIKAKKSRRSVLDETLLEVCGSDDLDQDLAKLDSEIKELQGNKGKWLTDGIQYMYKEFIKKLTVEGHEDKSEIPCPLCMRCFEETTLIDDLQTKLDMAPEKLASQHKQLKQKQERYQVLLDNKPIKMELDRLQTSELPDLEKQYSNMSLKFGDAGRSKEEAEETWSKLKEEETKAKQCLPDVAQIDTLQDEMREINRKIRNLESELPMSSTSKSSEELNTEKRELGQNLSKLTQAMDQTRHEIEASTNLIHRLKDKVNSIQAEKLKLASDLHKCEQLQDQQQTLQDDIKKLKDEIELNERSLAPLLREVEDLEGKKNEVSRRNNTSLTDATQKLQTLQNQLRRLESIHQEVQRFSNSSRTIKQIDDLEMSMNSSENKLAKLRDDVERLKKELVTCVVRYMFQSDRQRDLEDNSALRERRREIVEVDEEVERMKLELGGLDPVKLERKVRELNKEHSDLTKEIERNKVRQEGLEETVRGIKLELCRESLKFADERYKECMISATTLELASEDLDKYYKALDHAIMRYHKIKMEDINKIIRSLWQETYKGTDIDYIEICSSEDTGSSASTRRVFNYRVVMHCAGTAMDMRGRCSAGQKVLASLVIRLALAETFCISCGILALDEPTTNLDRANIDSLAEALLSIIETRSQQRNFQLVVITHDEEFVDLIGRSNYVDHFFRIKKDDRARSRIIRCPIRS
uniref:Rad50/SbcC-type AAA domain-containing protein n=1 Tax=Ciona savignyi TaxID=51511 RepID=H2ZIL4_CIOSA